MTLSHRIADAKEKLQRLTINFKELQEKSGSLSKSVESQGERVNKALAGMEVKLQCVRTLNHHASDVSCVQWSSDDEMFVSAGKDGQISVWNALKKKKIQSMHVAMKMLMTCAFEKKSNQLVAAGGADKVCSVFTVGQAGIIHPIAELTGHDGYISQCQFIDKNSIVTSSGDSTACLWDISSGRATLKFSDHAADCLAVALHPRGSVMATSSSDCTVKLCDIRSGRCTQTLSGHESDINSVSFFPDGNSLATASTDSTCRLFDIRSSRQLACFEAEGNTHNNCSGLSVCFSRSGRLLFTSYDDSLLEVWDLLDYKNTIATPFNSASVTYTRPIFSIPQAHSGSISTVDVNQSGQALATSSTDHSVKVWS